MIAEIHKNHLYLKPKPKKDVKDGITLILNKSISKGMEAGMTADIYGGIKKYDLPKLPEGVFIVSVALTYEK